MNKQDSVIKSLDHRADSLPDDVTKHLRSSRLAAISAAETIAEKRQNNFVFGGAIAACCSVFVVGLVMFYSATPPNQSAADQWMVELELISDDEDFEVYEDTEFYAWLVAQNENDS